MDETTESQRKRTVLLKTDLRTIKSQSRYGCVFINPQEMFGMHIMNLLYGLGYSMVQTQAHASLSQVLHYMNALELQE